MEPLTILTCIGGVIGQIVIIGFRVKPVFDFASRLVDCLQNPRPPPPQAVTTEAIMDAVHQLCGSQE
ncbi:hypothetical protein OPV22_005690 [Ensete ventricosum]|uniref:Uncharacterized protein n=1 Tax=Ensete ventricosum TaxID=4639 RepID=A0AAV8RLK2_ENSVE|nr:hypothetical protein OPV22_005690 [Ensete ventricosum]